MNQVKTAALLGFLSALLVGISVLILGGTNGAIVGLVLAAVMNFSSWFFSDKIALSAYRAVPVGPDRAPELHRMVERLSQRAGLPMPGVYLVPTQSANAFATGRDPHHAAVAVTEGILKLLPEDELEGVIAHELTHIRNRDTLTQSIAATIAGAISYLAQMASYGLWMGGRDRQGGTNPLGLLLTLLLAPLAASVIQMSISRTREFSADAGAAELTGNPRALARALERLEGLSRQAPLAGNPAFAPLLIVRSSPAQAFRNLFATHPPTKARVAALLKLERQGV